MKCKILFSGKKINMSADCFPIMLSIYSVTILCTCFVFLLLSFAILFKEIGYTFKGGSAVRIVLPHSRGAISFLCLSSIRVQESKQEVAEISSLVNIQKGTHVQSVASPLCYYPNDIKFYT